MRRFGLLLLVPSLAMLGCFHFQHTAGVCDCDPPPVGASLYTYPGLTRPAVPAPGRVALAPAAPMPPAPPMGPLGPVNPPAASPQVIPIAPHTVEPPRP